MNWSLRETAHRLCIALLCVIPAPAFAGSMTLLGAGGPAAATGSPMVTPLLSLAGSNTGPSTSAANYAPIAFGRAGAAWVGVSFENQRQIPFPVPGNITGLNVNFPSGTGSGVWSIGLMKNGTLTTLQCVTTTATTPATCTNSNIVSVAASDLLDWQACPGVFTAGSCVPGTAPTANTFLQISASFTGTNNGEGFLLANATAASVSNAAANYFGFGGGTGVPNATEVVVSGIVATGGVIDNLYAQTSAAPGAAPKQYVATLYKNGTSTGLTCTVTGASTTTCNSTGANVPVSVAAGDFISIEMCPGTVSGTCTPANTPTVGVYHAAVRWVPTIPGETLAIDTMIVGQGTTGTGFDYLNGASNTVNGAVTQVCNVVPVGMTVKKLRVAQSTAPGGATTRTVTLQEGTCASQANVGTPGNLSCTVTSAATTCSDTTNSFAATASTFLNWAVTVSGTNAAQTWFKAGSVVTSP